MKKRGIKKNKSSKKINFLKLLMSKNENFKKFILLTKLFLLIIIGFLPSFLFTVLFVQYGSPLSNYIQFISNLKSSWIAWISAIIIVSIGLFIRKISKSKLSIKKISKNKKLFLILILCLVGLFFLIALQSYLYVNFLLKNDILVKLSSDKTDIYFINSSQEDITFQISVTSNPFCSSECEYSFFDLSSGKEIESGYFLLNSISTKFKTYSLKEENYVNGSQTLNTFEVSCKSKKTALCYTKGKESKRSLLITLNYGLNESEIKLKEQLKKSILNLTKNFNEEISRLFLINNYLTNINISFSTLDEQREYYSFLEESLALNDSLNYLNNLWMREEFELALENSEFIFSELKSFSNKTLILKYQLDKDIKDYNSFLGNITYFYNSLDSVSQENISSEDCLDLNQNINIFNNLTREFLIEKNLLSQRKIIYNLSNLINPFIDNLIVSTNSSLCTLNYSLSLFSAKNISLSYNETNQTLNEVILNDPVPLCCFYKECEKCCDNTCANKNYPVLFLHGHSINKKLPADYSLDVFNEIKAEFVKDKYVDAGAIILTSLKEENGLWGKLNSPIMVTGSYFFDTYNINNNEMSIASTIESIDTYAIRLNKLVELVKNKTNKDKIIIVAHSMGGLVTRRYIQIFGGENIDKIILITVPNNGIQDRIKDYCGVLGSEIACKEMDKDSTFINQLNKENSSSVKTYNIIGIGCDMGEETGDGILKNSSQYLSYAKNYYISGECNELTFDFFHESVMYPEKYPEIYEILQKIL